jgi:hypothetical protein
MRSGNHAASCRNANRVADAGDATDAADASDAADAPDAADAADATDADLRVHGGPRHNTDLKLNPELYTSTLVWLLLPEKRSAASTASFASRRSQVEILQDTKRHGIPRLKEPSSARISIEAKPNCHDV